MASPATSPTIRFKHDGKDETLICDIVAGCDGFHGVCRAAIPDGVLTIYDRDLSVRLARHHVGIAAVSGR